MFNQNFSAVAADRDSESLTNRQRNPSQQAGFVFQWRKPIKGRQSISAGFEGREVCGHSAENTFNNSRLTAFVDAGGRHGLSKPHRQSLPDQQHAGVDRWTTAAHPRRRPTSTLTGKKSFRVQALACSVSNLKVEL